MLMKICPYCLIWVSKEKHLCHQCGHDINKRSANKSQGFLLKSKSNKSFFLHKFKFLQSTRTIWID
jgi:uncharacterized membrane protein YvbJ